MAQRGRIISSGGGIYPFLDFLDCYMGNLAGTQDALRIGPLRDSIGCCFT